MRVKVTNCHDCAEFPSKFEAEIFDEISVTDKLKKPLAVMDDGRLVILYYDEVERKYVVSNWSVM